MEFLKEYRRGYSSKFKFKCKMCGTTSFITSENDKCNYLPINPAFVNGSLAVGKFFFHVTDDQWVYIGKKCISV